MSAPTNREIIAELRREAALRRGVYPKWVASGRLKEDVAARRIELMDAAADALTRMGEGVQGSLEL